MPALKVHREKRKHHVHESLQAILKFAATQADIFSRFSTLLDFKHHKWNDFKYVPRICRKSKLDPFQWYSYLIPIYSLFYIYVYVYGRWKALIYINACKVGCKVLTALGF